MLYPSYDDHFVRSCDCIRPKCLFVFRLYVVVEVKNVKYLEKSSFLRSVFHALGIEKSFASHLPSQAETQSDVSVRYQSYSSKRIAFLEAECAKARGLIEIQHKTIL